MNSFRIVLHRHTCHIRYFHKCISQKQTEAVTTAVVEKLTIPVPEGVDKPVTPKIDKIAQEITSLNLLEVAELSDLLKKRLNLPDASFMPAGGFISPKAEEEEVAPKVVKTSFMVKLMKFDETKKVALIKEIRNVMPGTNLVQAKKFVESAPQVIMNDVNKEEAEKIKEILSAAGGEVAIE